MSESGKGEALPPSVPALAVAIAAIWGFNFVAIKVGVAGLPPLLLVALRFFFSALPAVFFVPRPPVPWRFLAAYGLFLGLGQFGFLFSAIKLGAPAGLASIILQSQAFFTALLGALIFKESLRAPTLLGMGIAALGLGLIAFGGAGTAGGAGAPGGLGPSLVAMLLLAGLGWAAANLTARGMPKAGGLGLTVWSSLFSPLPLLALSLALEGPEAAAAAFRDFSLLSLGALAYLVLLSTLVAYGLWNRLIIAHGAGRIAPFSFLVPVFSLLATSLVLGERLRGRDLAGAALVLAGLLVHVFGGRRGDRPRGRGRAP